MKKNVRYLEPEPETAIELSNRAQSVDTEKGKGIKRLKKAVNNKDHANNGKRFISIPLQRILNIVAIKLIDAAIEDAPAKCRLKIAKSTAGPECA